MHRGPYAYILTENSLVCPDRNAPFFPSSSSFVVFVALITINLSVVVGNSMVVSAVYISMKLRTVTNMLIVSLAVSDFMIGVCVLPYSVIWEVHKVWLLGDSFCSAWLAVDVWMCTASIFNLCAISLDRYIAIAHPLSYPNLMTFTRAKLLVAGVWILSFMVCFPPLVGWTDNRATLDPDTELPPDFLRPKGNLSEAFLNATDLSEILNLTSNMTEDYLRTIYSSESVDYLQQARTKILDGGFFNDTTFFNDPPRIHIAMEKYRCPRSCELTNDTGYVLYSAIGSYFLPMIVMLFFYWRIFRAARKARKSVKKGYREAKGNGGENGNTVTLRIHRGKATVPTEQDKEKHDKNAPKMDLKELKRTQPLRTEENAAAISETSFIEQPLPTTSSGKTEAKSVSAATAKEKTSLESGHKKKSLFRTKDIVYSVFYAKKSKKDGEPTCVIEIQEPAGTTPQNVSTDPVVSNQGQDDNVKIDITEPEEIPVEKPKSYFRQMFDNFKLKFKERLLKLMSVSKAAKTLGIVVGVFVVCWTPFFTIYVVRGFCISCVNAILFSILFWLGYLNSALNPFIYSLFSEDFREGFRLVIDRLLCRKRPEDVIEMKVRKKESRFSLWVKKYYPKKEPAIPKATATAQQLAIPITGTDITDSHTIVIETTDLDAITSDAENNTTAPVTAKNGFEDIGASQPSLLIPEITHAPSGHGVSVIPVTTRGAAPSAACSMDVVIEIPPSE